jgi:hypothetical protein
MNRLFIILSLLLLAKASFAQNPKDTMVTNVPTLNNGRILYTDSLIVKGRSKHILDSIAQNWYISYFFHRLPEKDTLNSIYGRGLLEYKVKPGMINIDYEAAITVQITCKDGWYKYQMYNIKFRPKSGVLNDVGYQNDPEYLIKIYKQKHLSFAEAWNVSRGQIRDYISKMNKAVQECIASLNKTMAN